MLSLSNSTSASVGINNPTGSVGKHSSSKLSLFNWTKRKSDSKTMLAASSSASKVTTPTGAATTPLGVGQSTSNGPLVDLFDAAKTSPSDANYLDGNSALISASLPAPLPSLSNSRSEGIIESYSAFHQCATFSTVSCVDASNFVSAPPNVQAVDGIATAVSVKHELQVNKEGGRGFFHRFRRKSGGKSEKSQLTSKIQLLKPQKTGPAAVNFVTRPYVNKFSAPPQEFTSEMENAGVDLTLKSDLDTRLHLKLEENLNFEKLQPLSTVSNFDQKDNILAEYSQSPSNSRRLPSHSLSVDEGSVVALSPSSESVVSGLSEGFINPYGSTQIEPVCSSAAATDGEIINKLNNENTNDVGLVSTTDGGLGFFRNRSLSGMFLFHLVSLLLFACGFAFAPVVFLCLLVVFSVLVGVFFTFS